MPDEVRPNILADVRSVVDRVLEFCDHLTPGTVAGLYLYGSATRGGLRGDSDIDLLLITRSSLAITERRRLTDVLLAYTDARSGVAGSRPVELTSVVHSALVPWTYPPVCDYQYGEWLLDDLRDGAVPQPHIDPDLAILLASARPSSEPLSGPPLAELAEAVPADDVRRAIHDSLDGLLGDLHGDERNVLLTLARMIVTLETGDIVSKDEAARQVSGRLAPSDAAVLDLARQGYLGEAVDDWGTLSRRALTAAHQLGALIRML